MDWRQSGGDNARGCDRFGRPGRRGQSLFPLGDDPDAAENVRAHEVDEADIGFVEGVVPGGSSGRLRLNPQLLVHRQTSFQQHRPLGGQVIARTRKPMSVNKPR